MLPRNKIPYCTAPFAAMIAGLAEDDEVEMPMADPFRDEYFGSLQDRFGIHEMIDDHSEST